MKGFPKHSVDAKLGLLENDNRRIKRRNWTQVRQVMVYSRHESGAELRQMRSIYATMKVLASLFKSSAKLMDELHEETQAKRRYNTPVTSLDRLTSHCHSGERSCRRR